MFVGAKKAAGKQQKAGTSDARRNSVVLFNQYDTDGDGKLDQGELLKMVREFARGTFTVSERTFGALFREMDANGDGTISVEEFHDYLFSAEEAQRKKDDSSVDAGNKRKAKLAEKFDRQDGDDSNLTESLRMRKEVNKTYYTRPHGRLSEFGGVLSRGVVAAIDNVEQNPDMGFTDPEALTSLKSETPSLRTNVGLIKDALALQIRARGGKSVFDQYDVNGDGKLNQGELLKMVREFARGSFTVSDKTFGGLFREMDSNKDGTISSGEFCDYLFSDAEKLRKKDDSKVNAGNKRKAKLAEKYARTKSELNDSKMTASMRQRKEVNERYYTRPHGRLSEAGGVLSRGAVAAIANAEENPDMGFTDPEALTSLKSETPSLRTNVGLIKDALVLQIRRRNDGMFAGAKKGQDGESTEGSSVFNQYDVNGDGKLNQGELLKMVREFARGTFTVSDKTFGALFREMDSNNDSTISVEEFHDYLFSDAEKQRKKEHAKGSSVSNKQKAHLAQKYQLQALNPPSSPIKTTKALEHRRKVNEQYYTRPHGRLSEVGGVMSRGANPGLRNAEENPMMDFVDAEALTTLNSETPSLRTNIDVLKDALQMQVILRRKNRKRVDVTLAHLGILFFAIAFSQLVSLLFSLSITRLTHGILHMNLAHGITDSSPWRWHVRCSEAKEKQAQERQAHEKQAAQ
jgi:Ca2+-binding EF-hand superfamily protein